MNKKYRYELRKGSKKELCPNCRKKTFTPYVSVATGEVANVEKFGICDRINNCAYLMYPPSDESQYEEWIQPDPQTFTPVEPDFIPRGTVESTFRNFHENVFVQFLRKTFGADKAIELQEDYNIGTAKNNGTIFWQQDKDGKFRTGKVMYYGADGRRLKNKNSWYLHKRVKPDFELQQVFFGEHLINEDKPVALCESEKTAILMSVWMPKYTWLASGGSNMLNDFRLSRLPRLDYVSPDNGQFEDWRKRTKHFNPEMDITVDRAVREGVIEEGADVLDLWMVKKQLV